MVGTLGAAPVGSMGTETSQIVSGRSLITRCGRGFKARWNETAEIGAGFICEWFRLVTYLV
jgi:hypothetical protein